MFAGEGNRIAQRVVFQNTVASAQKHDFWASRERFFVMEWNIQARAHACQACEKPFADKESFHTLLFDEKGGYQRLDVCQKCWEEQYSQGATERKGFISYWQTVYSVPPPAPPEPIQKESAEGLLRKLMERNEAKHGAAMYVLGAMLERKRILKVKAQLARDGQRVFVYEHGKTGDLFHIPDPNLQLHQLEAVQHEVLQLLQHGVDGEGRTGAEGAESAGAPGSEQVGGEGSQVGKGEPQIDGSASQEGPVAQASESASVSSGSEAREEGSQEKERVNAA